MVKCIKMHTGKAPKKGDVCAKYLSTQEIHVCIHTFNILICSHYFGGYIYKYMFVDDHLSKW